MDKLLTKLTRKKHIRVIGIDDAPFKKGRDTHVNISAIVCANTRFEGMLWGQVTQDGDDATDTILQLVRGSKFYAQLDVVLIDGIAVGGFNIIKLKTLAENLMLPCVAVMRKHPDLNAVNNALKTFADVDRRKQDLSEAGDIHQHQEFFFQVAGSKHTTIGKVLEVLTDTGNVPEALRLAHLIGSAVKTGESSKRA